MRPLIGGLNSSKCTKAIPDIKAKKTYLHIQMLEDVTTVTGSTDIFNGFKILYNDENHIVGVFKTSEIMQRSGWGYVHMFSIL